MGAPDAVRPEPQVADGIPVARTISARLKAIELATGQVRSLDEDGDVDLSDLARFQGCFDGPHTPSGGGCC